MIELHKKTMEEFMGLYIDFWQFLHIPSELRIKKKEREFMIHTLVLNAKGINIGSKEYVEHMIPRLNLKLRTEVYNYRSRLKGKGFLVEENDLIRIPQALNVIEVPEQSYFQFSVKCDEPTHHKNQKPVRTVKALGDLDRPIKTPTSDRPKLPDLNEEIKLPEGPNERETGYDPVGDATKLARAMAQQQEDSVRNPPKQVEEEVESHYEAPIPMRGRSGYSSGEYDDSQKERDVAKLPPIPGMADFPDDRNTNHVEEPEYIPSTPRRNIINLDD